MTLPLPLFDRSDFLVFDGELLQLEREWEDGTLSISRVRSHRPFLLEDHQNPTTEWFHGEWAAGRLHLECSRQARLRRPPLLEHAPDSGKARSGALVQFVCIALDRANCPRSDRAIERELIRIWTPEVEERYGPRPPESTARKWLTRTVVDNRTQKGCAPRNGEGRRRSRLDSEVLKLRTDAALYFWSDFATSVEDAFGKLVEWVRSLNAERLGTGLPRVKCCSKEWLRKRIRKLENRATYACKYGERAAARRFDANGQSPITTQVLELCSIDHHTWDNLCGIDDEQGDQLLLVGRPTITVVLDHHTGCILAAVVHMTDPSLSNMLDAIKTANRPKLAPTRIGARFGKSELLASIYGKPDTILPDNAWEFTGTSAQDSFLDLGPSVDWARAGEPQDKSLIERLWRFFSLVVALKLPSAVFDPKLMRELGYNPRKTRPVMLSDLRVLVAEAVAFWHLKPYRRVGGPPALMWEKAVRRRGGIPVIRDDSKLDQLMGEVVETSLTTSGVMMFGRQYTHRQRVELLLNHMVGTSPTGRVKRLTQTARVKVKVKYNPADVTHVHVYDRTTGEYVTLECADRYVHGLSKQHLDALAAFAKLRNRSFMSPEDTAIARAMLNDFIREAAPALALRHQKKFAKLVNKGIGAQPSGGVATTHAPSSYSGMMPVIDHDTGLLTRTDAGQIPKGPSPRGKQQSSRSDKKRQQPKTPGRSALPQLATAAANDLGDWGGLV